MNGANDWLHDAHGGEIVIVYGTKVKDEERELGGWLERWKKGKGRKARGRKEVKSVIREKCDCEGRNDLSE